MPNLRIACATALSKEGVPAVKISDFTRHLAYFVNEKLNKNRPSRLLVTAHGNPDFLALSLTSDPEDWIRQEYPTALSRDRPRPKSHGMGHYVRLTDFRNHRPTLLAEYLPKVNEFLVTRKGWPAFTVRQASLDEIDMNQTIRYEPVSTWPDPTEETDNG